MIKGLLAVSILFSALFAQAQQLVTPLTPAIEAMPEAQLLRCQTDIEDYVSFVDFNLTPGALGSRFEYEIHADEITLDNGDKATLRYRLKEKSKETATVWAWIRINDKEEVLSLIDELPVTGKVTTPVKANNPSKKISLSCWTLKTEIPKSQKPTHGGFFHKYR